MKRWKVRQYLPALLWYLQRRVEGGRGAVVSVHIRDICGVDRWCGIVAHWLMKSLIEKRLAKRHKRDTYLIERSAAEEVLTVLRKWI
jgi:hypothetical protein